MSPRPRTAHTRPQGKTPGASPTPTRLTDDDIYLFNEGSHFHLAQKLGAHLVTDAEGRSGAVFAVWAPDAHSVSVMGTFNDWDKGSLPLEARAASGIWEGFVPGAKKGQVYKYHIVSRHGGYRVDKADPFSVHQQCPPETGSVLWDLEYSWGDAAWMERRKNQNPAHEPMSIYEVHLGSWARVPEEGYRSLSYLELADRLADHVTKLGFTHVEMLPVMEHPFFASWGYQASGFFAPTSRYGNPQEFMTLVDRLHQRGIGVIIDWVPSHFVKDEHGLGFFDGSHLYEHADARKGIHPDWDSLIFNYGRNEVRSFLISSALHWLEVFHADGLRVDAVASMLYLDYSRKEGEWIPNSHGGNENLEAISLLRRCNEESYKHCDGIQTIAEESTSWPMVSRPTYLGGLGFGMKWDMGWMHDMLDYMSKDPVFRRFHHERLTFRMLYSFSENFVLPLSHDEVVHGKSSLLGKMPGDEWQKLANLRLLYGYMYAQPGKKLLFMGAEVGQWSEWNHDGSVDWSLLEQPAHQGIQRWVTDLNHAYRNEKALHTHDFGWEGFEWVDCNDAESSVISLLRKDPGSGEVVLGVFNFTPMPRKNYRVGVPTDGFWQELLNSDAHCYGGSDLGNTGGREAIHESHHGRPFSLEMTLPPLAAVFWKR
jgi:1,4-alpha-glucan branching enzyme